MTVKELEEAIYDAVDSYVNATEGWEDPQIVINRKTGFVEIRELEETDAEAPDLDVYDMMDFVEMTPEGEWRVDKDAVESAASTEADEMQQLSTEG